MSKDDLAYLQKIARAYLAAPLTAKETELLAQALHLACNRVGGDPFEILKACRAADAR